MWSIAGKTVLITGATSGIGLETAVALAKRGASPIIVGRDAGRVAAAVDRIRATSGRQTSGYRCDLSSQAEVRRLAAEIRRDHARIEVLINNAGGVQKRRAVTVDGIERTFATNHLAAFLLTTLLLDVIVGSAPARIVTVSSIGHRRGTIDFNDLGFERGYWIMRAYCRSKLANVLFATELARRLAGTGVTSNSVHPGSVATNIWSGAPAWTKPYIALFLRPSFISAEAGADTIVQLVSRPELEGVSGQYFENSASAPPAPLALDAALAQRLWQVSEALVTRPGTGG